ncbi:MAG TPA: hypothetical protein VMD49_10620 [Steroidobacteraceae bacterium]|nr:hypothetical protein [Steroidobacteraceae bacterium]
MSLSKGSAKQSLETFLARYDPAIAQAARQALAALRKRLPGAFELVYDNYNALAIGFGPTERAGDVALSIALYPRWVSLFFFGGPALPDPQQRLKGSGSRVRHIVLEAGAATLAEPAVRELIRQAIARADPPLPQSGKGQIIIKSISAKQRPRRPHSGRPSRAR